MLDEKVVEITPSREAGSQEGGGDLGGRGEYQPSVPTNHGQEEGSASMFAGNLAHHAGPAGPVRASLWEVFEGDGGEFARVFRALAKVGWSGDTIRDLEEAAPKFYADYPERIPYRDDAECGREAYRKLRAEQSRATGGGIMGASRLQPGEADRFRTEASRGRVELDSVGCADKNFRGAIFALLRDMNTAQHARGVALLTATDRDSEASKVKGRLTELRGRLTTRPPMRASGTRC